MTRKSKRELERELENMDSTEEEETPILFIAGTEEGETVDLDGDPIPKATLDRADVIFNFTAMDHYPDK